MSDGRKEIIGGDEILRVFAESDGPFLFTGEVSSEIGFTRSGTLKRLKDLGSHDLLNVKRSGREPGWWLSENGREVLEGSD
jgi:hypothetical protein